MLKLHDYAASANCFKVRMLLSQLGLAYERVPVDIFAGDSQTAEYLARNPAGRTPLLETENGAAIPESGAILLYLAEGTPFLPDDRIERAHVHAWMFFEQNLLEPNVGTARFWRLTGRDTERPEAFARHLEAGAAALAVLERGLAGKEFLVGGRYSVADCALYAYTRVAHEAGYEIGAYPAVAAWLERVAATPGAIDDLEPYPPSAHVGRGGRSAHDAPKGQGGG
jgi:glutathione S-transferase